MHDIYCDMVDQDLLTLFCMTLQYFIYIIMNHPDYEHISPRQHLAPTKEVGIYSEAPVWIVSDKPRKENVETLAPAAASSSSSNNYDVQAFPMPTKMLGDVVSLETEDSLLGPFKAPPVVGRLTSEVRVTSDVLRMSSGVM